MEKEIDYIKEMIINNNLSNNDNKELDKTSKKDLIEAFDYLLNNYVYKDTNLTSEILINTANIINRNSPYIRNGYRKHNGIFNNKKLLNYEEIEQTINTIINFYNENNRVEYEAALHIAICNIQPFEDGNHRLAYLLLLANYLKKNEPVPIVTEEDNDYYQNIINTSNTEELIKYLNNNKKKRRK